MAAYKLFADSTNIIRDRAGRICISNRLRNRLTRKLLDLTEVLIDGHTRGPTAEKKKNTCQIFPEHSVPLRLLEELKKRSLGKDNLITSNKCHLLARVYQIQAELTCPSSTCLIGMTTTVISTLLRTRVISLTNS